MRYLLLKLFVEYLRVNAQNIKNIRRVENNTIIIEFNNKNIIYFDLSKINSLFYKT